MIDPVMPTYARAPLAFTHGEGSWLIEASGRRFLDLASGIAVTGLGHAHPKLVQILADQAGKLWHTSNLYNIPAQQALARALVDLTFADTVFFTNSGAEAMECLIKTIRKYHFAKGAPERQEIITFKGAFHGRTLATISAVGTEKMTTGFAPLLHGFTQLDLSEIAKIEAHITAQTAGIIIEPIQGEGGIIPVNDADLRHLREVADRHGLLLGFDEVQCGMGRTGRLFAHEWSGVAPDVMAVAKGIGNGFPLGACLATEEAASGMTAGSHGSTYGGNPLACSVGLGVVEEIAQPAFLEEVRRKSGLLRQKLEGLVAAHPEVFESVRGVGLMLGLKCRMPNLDVIRAGYAEELLCVPASDNVVRLLPALTISDAEMHLAVERLDALASQLKASATPAE